MKILYVVNCSNFFHSHFSTLAKAVLDRGHSVTVIAGNEIKKNELEAMGFDFIYIPLSRGGKNIFKEIQSFFLLYKAIKEILPDIMHMFTIKPVIYGGLISKFFAKVNAPIIVASITGLGSASLSKSILGKALWSGILSVYRLTLSKPSIKVVFENSDDKDLFVSRKIIRSSNAYIVNGAGVDTSIFSPKKRPKSEELKVVLVARLLKDKGVQEYIEAGRKLKNSHITLQLVGGVDCENASSMDQLEIDAAHENGYINYLGHRSDIAQIYQQADVACLPSYREGLPRSLIEAAACGLAIVTTNVPGCRQMIFDNSNGLLVEPQDSESLVHQLEFLANKPDLVKSMGDNSRKIAVELFDHSKIIDSFFKIYEILE